MAAARLSHPFEHWPRQRRRSSLIAGLLAAVFLFAVIALLDSPLRENDEGGTVALEVAGSTKRAEEITTAWRADGHLDNAAFIDGLDFLYALLHSAVLAALCVAASSSFGKRGHQRLAQAGTVAAWVASAIVLFDWAENAALAVVLLDGPAAPWPAIALAAAIPKFAGTALALIFALAGGAAAILTKRSS